MKVIATARGYYGHLREPGDVFDVEDGSKATWFKPPTKKEAEKANSESESPKENGNA